MRSTGDVCTPGFRLSPRPGSLTVHLMKNHSLALEHGDHAKHRVFYGQEGEPLTVGLTVLTPSPDSASA